MIQIGVGLVLSMLISGAAYWLGALRRSGVFGAVLVGTAVFASGGLLWAVLIVGFFVSSSALSHYRSSAKASLADMYQKPPSRGLSQVLANGGWGALLGLLYALQHESVLFAAYVGSLSSVNADTWATEIGALGSRPPRLVTTGRTVRVGTSGGVSVAGTIASLLGGLFIGLVALGGIFFFGSLRPFTLEEMQLGPGLTSGWNLRGLWLPVLAAMSGLAGSLFDSFLGATLQATYYCDYDKKETERRLHTCGRPTRLVRGLRWMDNDVVNFLASIFGSLIAAVLWAAVS